MKVANTEQMREIDRRTTEDFHVPGLVLMENAALRVVDIVCDRFGPLKDKSISIVCGNGGDGLAIARHLSSRLGAKVTVWRLGSDSRLKGEALTQYKMAKSFGLTLKSAAEIDLSDSSLVIDALFGTGIKGAVTGEAAFVIAAINSSKKPVVAVDVPSGLESDTGRADGAVVRADITVTFALPKYGMMVYPGAAYVGELVVSDIGTPKLVLDSANIDIFSTEPSDVGKWLPIRENNRDSNKGSFGHVIVFAGSMGFVGAPILVAEAAARIGSGLVTLAIPEGLQQSVMSRVSPTIMTRGLSPSRAGTLGRDAVEAALALIEKASVAALGPGLGDGDDVAEFVREFTSLCPLPLVIDADALNALSKEADHGASILRSRKAATILTPHAGEMGRLLGISSKSVQDDRRGAVMHAKDIYNCVVLLKGARTLIVSPEGKMYVNTSGNSGMATGGSGDALTGVIAGLMSQKLNPFEAAVAGAYLHGCAGDLAVIKEGGTAGIIATDLIGMLPRAMTECNRATLER